jgi:choline dehydrogenase-like flavoprotein
VLAPNAKLRPLVVPQGPPAQAKAATEAAVAAECEVETAQARPHRISWARLLKRVFDIDSSPPAKARGSTRTPTTTASEEHFGCRPVQVRQKDGERRSAKAAYIRPNLGRPNLLALSDKRTRRVLLEQGRAVGVEFWRAASSSRCVPAAR